MLTSSSIRLRPRPWYVAGFFTGCVLMLAWRLALGASATRYTVVDLGQAIAASLDADAPTRAVGSVLMPDQTGSLLYPTPTPWGTLPGGDFSVGNFTRNGLSVGYCGTGAFSLQTHACTYDATNGLRDLGTLGGAQLFSAATGCNKYGLVSGYGENVAQTRILPIVFVNGVPNVPRTLWDQNAFMDGINDACYMVGSGADDDGITHAMLWNCGGGAFDLGPNSIAIAINNSNGSILTVELEANVAGTAIWRSDGKHPLGPVPGYTATQPGGLNDSTVAVGTSYLFGGSANETQMRLTLWEDNDTPIDVTPLVQNAAGWVFEEGRDINNEGVILGQGRLNGVKHAFLLVPVALAVARAVVTPPANLSAVPEDGMPLPVVESLVDQPEVLAMAMRQPHKAHRHPKR